jgi:hypothetical protein
MKWWLDRRFLLAGALVLWGIWAVECLRKGGLIWPWPLVPLAIWAGCYWLVRRRDARLGS